MKKKVKKKEVYVKRTRRTLNEGFNLHLARTRELLGKEPKVEGLAEVDEAVTKILNRLASREPYERVQPENFEYPLDTVSATFILGMRPLLCFTAERSSLILGFPFTRKEIRFEGPWPEDYTAPATVISTARMALRSALKREFIQPLPAVTNTVPEVLVVTINTALREAITETVRKLDGILPFFDHLAFKSMGMGDGSPGGDDAFESVGALRYELIKALIWYTVPKGKEYPPQKPADKVTDEDVEYFFLKMGYQGLRRGHYEGSAEDANQQGRTVRRFLKKYGLPTWTKTRATLVDIIERTS